jgi:hypothetical protein
MARLVWIFGKIGGIRFLLSARQIELVARAIRKLGTQFLKPSTPTAGRGSLLRTPKSFGRSRQQLKLKK